MSAFEQHYMPKELAQLWKCSRQTVRKKVDPYLHLIPDTNKKSRSRFGPIKRPYRMLKIPKSLAERIYREQFMGQVA